MLGDDAGLRHLRLWCYQADMASSQTTWRRTVVSLAMAAALVALLQPIYFAAMASLDHVVSKERTWRHIQSAFQSGVLVDASHRNQLIASGDRFTDCYSLGEGLQPNASAIERGIMAPRPASERHACDDLQQAADDPGSVNWERYVRYWHGYRVYSAPLASLLPILAGKIINLAVLVAITAFFVLQSSRLIGGAPTLWLCAPVLFMTDYVRIWHVTPHTVSTVVILGGAGLFAMAIQKDASERALIIQAAALGSVFNFVDFLVNPPWLPMLLAFFLVASGRTARIALLCVATWFGAYAGTWFAKWFAAYLVDPSFNIATDVLGAALFRIGGDNAKVLHLPLAATVKVFANSLLSWGMLLFVPLLFVLHTPKIPRFATAWPALIPIGWFELLSNHSQIHTPFVSRSAAAAIGVTLASAQLNQVYRGKQTAEKEIGRMAQMNANESPEPAK